MRHRLRISNAFHLGRPAITSAWVAVLTISGCSRPAGEAVQPAEPRAAQRPEVDLPDPSSDRPPPIANSATDFSKATPTPPSSGADPETAVPGSRREQMLQRFTDRHGRDNVVVIRVSHAEGLKPGQLVQKLTHDLGGTHYFATRPSADAILAVPYSGEIEDVLAFIDWGTLTSIDPEQRVILVDGRQN